MQLKTIFISSTKYIYAKTLTVSERTFKIKAISHLEIAVMLLVAFFKTYSKMNTY